MKKILLVAIFAGGLVGSVSAIPFPGPAKLVAHHDTYTPVSGPAKLVVNNQTQKTIYVQIRAGDIYAQRAWAHLETVPSGQVRTLLLSYPIFQMRYTEHSQMKSSTKVVFGRTLTSTKRVGLAPWTTKRVNIYQEDSKTITIDDEKTTITSE